MVPADCHRAAPLDIVDECDCDIIVDNRSLSLTIRHGCSDDIRDIHKESLVWLEGRVAVDQNTECINCTTSRDGWLVSVWLYSQAL